MTWLKNLADLIAQWCLKKAKKCPDISAKEFDQWKKDYKKDFEKEFK